LEYKRSTDRDEGFLEVKEAEANEQHKSIIGALKVAAPKWEFEQINFVVGNRRSVVESDFYTKLQTLDREIMLFIGKPKGRSRMISGYTKRKNRQALRRSCDTGM